MDVRFLRDEEGELYIEVEDDGLGMDDTIIKDVWCIVATPFRLDHRSTKRVINGRNKLRRVTGAKGLGRLSAARLGRELELLTRQEAGKVWKLTVRWEDIAEASKLEDCGALLWKASPKEFVAKSGTLLRIRGLHSTWSEDELDELSEGLSRLKPPFAQLGDFRVFLTDERLSAQPTEIHPSELIDKPVYCIKGRLSANGKFEYEYRYQPYSGRSRKETGEKRWSNIVTDLKSMKASTPTRYLPADNKPSCGPLEFEIRAWDLDKESVGQAAERFHLGRSSIRAEIRTFKGISVYRDQILVLPKSETARDWLGLDLRRVSRTGTRISTSQIVGFVGITAEANPKIEDTSDRERLARNDQVREFESLLQYIVEILEVKRDADRPREELHVGDLFKDLDADPVIAEVQQMASENAGASELLPYLERLSAKLQATKSRLERTFGYYNRLATIGTLSQMLVHEVGNNNVLIGALFANSPRLYRHAGTATRVVP